MEQQNETEILEDWKQDMYVDPVSPFVRFTHHVVDSIAFIVITYVPFSKLGTILAIPPVKDLREVFSNEQAMKAYALNVLISNIFFIIYYTLFEGLTKGRTLGKLATGSIVIREDGHAFTFKDAFIRSLCRAIPFEALSAFGYRPWHDSLSRTAVVKKTWVD